VPNSDVKTATNLASFTNVSMHASFARVRRLAALVHCPPQ
jgi:hypothetical protein